MVQPQDANGGSPLDFSSTWRRHIGQGNFSDRFAAGLITLALSWACAAVLASQILSPARVAVRQPVIMVRLLASNSRPIPQINIVVRMMKMRVANPVAPQFTIQADAVPDAGPLTAPPPLPSAPVQAVSLNVPLNFTPAIMDPDYLMRISLHVRRYLVYLPETMRRTKGLVYVHFAIDAKGNLLLATVAKSSGSAALDDAALALMRRSQPLPPIPEHLGMNRLNALLPICFNIENGGGMGSGVAAGFAGSVSRSPC